ncbi:MAG: methylaspartate mutase subunit S [Bacteroidales bacterium]|jgi:methylaspartate mutase sigma subunit
MNGSMESKFSQKPRVVFGVIGDDIHVVANRILAIGLDAAGFMAINLGTHNTAEDFVEAAIESEAHAVLVSSVNGEGETWCPNFRQRFIEKGMEHIILYVGGNLVVGERRKEDVINLFRSYGFDRVFYQQTDFETVFNLLKEDMTYGNSKY